MSNARNSWRTLWFHFPLRTRSRFFNWFLFAIPATFILQHVSRTSHLLLFALAAAAIVPLATTLGTITEELSMQIGPRAGGLLNATLGNAAELILGFFMVRAHETEVVKASLSGSIIGNILLVLGMSALFAGRRTNKHALTRQTTQRSSAMLVVAVAALLIPAVFSLSLFGALKEHNYRIILLSRWTSVILVFVYGFGLAHMLIERRPVEREQVSEGGYRSVRSAVFSLAVVMVLLCFVSEILVGQIEAAKVALRMSDLFMGIIVIAIIGNVAEHTSALLMAQRGRMELAYVIAVGSSVQIALLVAPVLVLLAWVMRMPMSLLFTPLEVAGIVIAVAAVTVLAPDRESTWLEGVQLLAIYVIFALAVYLMPSSLPS